MSAGPAAEAIVESFRGQAWWGWKDPRNSLTLPFWQTILDEFRVVVVVRHPLEVALSLRHRNGFSLALGLTLWHVSYLRLLEATTPSERVVTHYDAYFPEPRAEVRRLLTGPAGSVDEALIAGLRATPDRRLHRLTTTDLRVADVSPEVAALYRRFCAEAGWHDGDVAPGDHQLWDVRDVDAHGGPAPGERETGVGRTSRLVLEVAALRRDLEEHRRSLAGREARVAELEGTMREREAGLVERDGRIAERNGRIVKREGRLVERDGQIAERDGRIAEQDGRIARLLAAVRERDAALRTPAREREAIARELATLRQTVAGQGYREPME